MKPLPPCSKGRMLLIRACKSKDAHKRLDSVFKRTYLSNMPLTDKIRVLSDIVSYFKLATVSEMVMAAYTAHHQPYEGFDFNHMLYQTLISYIQLAHVNRFNGQVKFQSFYHQVTPDETYIALLMNTHFQTAKFPVVQRNKDTEYSFISGYMAGRLV
jgi:hypothetical protein